MGAPEEEDSGPSRLGHFFGRNKGATGGVSTGGEPQWDDDDARRRRQTEELVEQGNFV